MPPEPGNRARRTSRDHGESHGQTRLAHEEKKDEGASTWAHLQHLALVRETDIVRTIALRNLPKSCTGAEWLAKSFHVSPTGERSTLGAGDGAAVGGGGRQHWQRRHARTDS